MDKFLLMHYACPPQFPIIQYKEFATNVYEINELWAHQNVCISVRKTTIVNLVRNQESMGTSKLKYFHWKYEEFEK